MNENNDIVFHDFVHPERHHFDQLENAIEEATIKISSQEAIIHEQQESIETLKQQLLQAQSTIQQLQIENEKLKRDLEKSTSNNSSSSGTCFVPRSSDSAGLAVVGRNAATHSSYMHQTISSNQGNAMTTQRNQQRSATSSNTANSLVRPKLQPVALHEDRSGVTTSSIPSIRPTRRTSSKASTSSISSKSSTSRKTSLRPTASSSSSNSSSSSTPSCVISEDELLARKLQQEELNSSPFQTYINNFDQVISNNYFDHYQNDHFGQVSQTSSSIPSNITGDESYEELLRLDENAVKIGVNKGLLWQFPTFIHDGTKSMNEENNSCVCCMEEYNKGDQLRRLTCFHTFHKDCIDQWLEGSHTCPICKLDLNEH
ncbi:hypothetical protein C9374_000175 [Naegleria lovaniensis]|uniref:RING-type domain-containing protein n=1 Tax=Naegleria lovaniensis TaxID=51637 RepID=A0AA88KPL7_NAELO|nr:uncharacterized protein C9374_000175 [Naegleria lovaniensis]KAG2388736.1 hypothetical protein C9374_000175 [Naegleria lovaniensis]